MAYQETEIMKAYTVVFDGLTHLGPGDSAITRDLAERLRPELPSKPKVADFGCGVGASTLVLAQSLPMASVLALDSHAPFIERLETVARVRGLGERISAVTGDMADPASLDGATGGFDLIWSESAIYSIGRKTAFNCWRPFLKPGGWLVFSDVLWQCDPGKRSVDASEFWETEYPDMTTADDIVKDLTATGFNQLDPLLCGRKPWSNYYEPLRDRLHLLQKHENHPQALIDLMAGLEREIAVYDCAGDDVALAFFLARRN